MKVLQLTQTGAIQEVQIASTLGAVNFSRVIVTVTPEIITQNSVLLTSTAIENTVSVSISGVVLQEGDAFQVVQNATYAVTEVQFLSPLQSGGLIALEVGDVLVIDFGVEPTLAPIEFKKQTVTVTPQIVADQYFDLPDVAQEYGLKFFISGLQMTESVDYTSSTASSVTRISFIGDLSTLGVSAIIAGDVLEIHYSVLN